MKLGFYTYSHIDRLGMEIEPVLEAVAAAGYDGIDISATWRDDLDPVRMPAEARGRYAEAAARWGLEIEAVVTHLGLVPALRQGLPLNLEGAVDVALAVGARMVTFHIGIDDGPPAGTSATWRAAVDHLKGACDYAGERGVLIALDGIWANFLVNTPELVLELIHDVGSPHLAHNFDPCYLELTGHPLDRATPLLGPHVVHAHVKDYTGRYPHFRHVIPGEGVLDHGRWIGMLANAGFDGYLVNECFTGEPFDRACSIGYRALSSAMTARGARVDRQGQSPRQQP